MIFDILDRRNSVTVFTNVEFTFDDGSKDTVEVAHFEPQSEEEIIQNIQNRYDSICLERTLNQ